MKWHFLKWKVNEEDGAVYANTIQSMSLILHAVERLAIGKYIHVREWRPQVNMYGGETYYTVGKHIPWRGWLYSIKINTYSGQAGHWQTLTAYRPTIGIVTAGNVSSCGLVF